MKARILVRDYLAAVAALALWALALAAIYFAHSAIGWVGVGAILAVLVTISLATEYPDRFGVAIGLGVLLVLVATAIIAIGLLLGTGIRLAH